MIWAGVLGLSFLGFTQVETLCFKIRESMWFCRNSLLVKFFLHFSLQLNYSNFRKRVNKREERDAKFSTVAYHMVSLDMENFNEKIFKLRYIQDGLLFDEYISKSLHYKPSQVEQDMYNEKKGDEWLVREKELMKDVEGWEIAKKNYSVRWTVPTSGC